MSDNPMNPFRKDTGVFVTNDTEPNPYVLKCKTLTVPSVREDYDVMDKKPDMVNHPEHYKIGGIETIDFVKAKLNTMTYLEPFQAYCIGNAMKYLSRAGHKGEFVEDIEKAIFYLNQALGKDQRNV